MRSPTPSPAPDRASDGSHARRWAAPVLAVTLLLGAAACSGGGSDSGASSGSGAQGEQAAGGGAVAAADSQAQTGDTSGDSSGGTSGTDSAAQGRAVVSTATLAVRVRDLPAAVQAATTRTTQAGGIVAASRSGGGEGSETAHLTLRVPAPVYPQVLDDLAGLGQETDRTTTSNDVTAEVADVGSRVTSAQAVLETFRSRLPQAKTVPDILAIEGEIARREADLEALQARQRVLADQTSLATVDVDLTRGAPVTAVAAPDPGFRGGLAAGWHALGETARVLALVVGAVLPFALPLALVGVPVAWVLRRRRNRGVPDAVRATP
jgi:hypothetical protein